jgi:CelD/BcsL family acetyltransferase involved in cellulose biosynthesis
MAQRAHLPEARDSATECPHGTPVSRAIEGYALYALTSDQALASKGLRRDWESLMSLAHPLNRVYASPTLYEHRHLTAPAPEDRVFVIRDGQGQTVGVCPIVFWRLSMSFQIRKRVLARIPLKAATVYGGAPLVPGDPALFRQLFEGMLEELSWCDCIFVLSLPVDSDACRYFYGEENRSCRYILDPRRLQPWEWLYHELGESREELLKGKKGTTRYQLRRRVKKLRELGGGTLECTRVETEDQVDAFYESALTVAKQSWQDEWLGRRLEETALYRENLLSLARLGCLRAYLLKCGGRPCSFVIGYQYLDVLHVEQTAYSSEFAAFSPGSVLYYLMLEDLHQHRRPTLVNHGMGATPHKRLFTNRSTLDTTVYLFRPTIRNRLGRLSHELFDAGLNFAKRLMKKGPSAPVEAVEGDE